jgi:hypothetical protein
MYGWIACVAVVFTLLEPRRAVIVSYLIGWLLLPVAGWELFGFLDYTKSTAVPVAIFGAIALFDWARLSRWRPAWIDLPIALVCVAPLLASLSNDLGWYDGLSGLASQVLTWGLPYLTGRLYFTSPEGMRQLGLGVLAGGLAYAPLCWWEIRMSPQLHTTVYGYIQHDWSQTLRSGGYRPMVFMHHGLMLGLWMSAAALIGLALWMSGAVRRVWGIPLAIAVPALIATAALGKSFGALVLLLLGAVVLWTMRSLRTSLPMALLVCVPATYVALRVSGSWSGAALASTVSAISSERAHSLSYRIEAEEQLRVRAEQKPWFGWGGWGRSFVRRFEDREREETVLTDSLWILVFGKYGGLGLISMLLTFLVPVLALWQRYPPRSWWRPEAVWPWALALVLTLYALDNLVNAMLNPIYLLIAGGLCGLASMRAAVPLRRLVARARKPEAASLEVQLR